jgi:hypothetical protein
VVPGETRRNPAVRNTQFGQPESCRGAEGRRIRCGAHGLPMDLPSADRPSSAATGRMTLSLFPTVRPRQTSPPPQGLIFAPSMTPFPTNCGSSRLVDTHSSCQCTELGPAMSSNGIDQNRATSLRTLGGEDFSPKPGLYNASPASGR